MRGKQEKRSRSPSVSTGQVSVKQNPYTGAVRRLRACLMPDSSFFGIARRAVPVTIGLHGPDILIDGDGMRVSGQGVISPLRT